MISIYLIVTYLYRKYGVPLHNFFENWTRGISHLKLLRQAFVTERLKVPWSKRRSYSTKKPLLPSVK